MNIDNITETEAFTILHSLMQRFGWAGTMFTRGDAESIFVEYFDQSDLTDEQWDKIRDSWAWRKGMAEQMAETGNALIISAIEDSGTLSTTSV